MTVPLYSDWTRASVALGIADDERWTPFGQAILIVQRPLVWLVTLESALPADAEAPVSAWVSPGNQGTLFDLSDLHEHTPISWIRGNGWAATLCPVKPEWGTKAFNQEQSVMEHEQLPLLAPCTSGQYVYGAGLPLPTGPSQPYLLPGVVSAAGPGGLFTTLPLQPRNLGAPACVVVTTGKEPEVRLLGLIEAAHPQAPPSQTLTVVRPISGAFALLSSEAATAQRELILSQST